MTKHPRPCTACTAEKAFAHLIRKLAPNPKRKPQRRPTAADGAALGNVSTRLAVISARLGGNTRAVPDEQLRLALDAMREEHP
jgi:hypothetical protein